ncbi:ABC transporter substrate-binding protein [Paenibacillus sp. 2KB_22]|uniref:ABC transporter substrate-binding protein n=1 Tax=Paenibacillus sp. 2KB_22 TaxID=3232978 RepID=UPI003F9BC076
MVKKAIFLMMAALLVFTAACSSGGGSEQGSSDGSVTLRIAWWGSDARHEYTQKVIDLYKSKNPNVKIDVEYASFDDYWKKLAPQAAANQLPDIVQMDISYISQYAQNGQLEDLAPYLGNQIKVDNVSENVISTGVINGKQYGVPAGVNVLGFQYDPALLKKAGVDAIPDNMTWESYEALGKQAAEKGLYLDGGVAPDIFFHYFLRTKGLSLYNAEGTGLGYDDDQLFVEFFGLMRRMIEQGAAPTPDVANQTKGIIEESDLVKEKGIGVWQWSNQFVALQQVANRPLEIAPMPGPDMEKGLYMQPSMYWGVTSNSKVKEEAAKFIDFWVNDVEANKLIKGERGVPISGAIKEAIAPELSDATKQVFEFVAAMEPKASPMSSPPPVGSPEVISALADVVEELNFGKITPQQAAETFRKNAESVLANNK